MNAIFKQNYTLELFDAFKTAYSCSWGLRGNKEFQDFLQKKFYNINYRSESQAQKYAFFQLMWLEKIGNKHKKRPRFAHWKTILTSDFHSACLVIDKMGLFFVGQFKNLSESQMRFQVNRLFGLVDWENAAVCSMCMCILYVYAYTQYIYE